VISPALANAYLHYALDLWVHRWRQEKAAGDVIIIRYADDFIAGFQHEHKARAFLQDLHERLRKFELALHPAKTRLVRFGRPGWLARTYPVEDFHLLSSARLAWRTLVWVHGVGTKIVNVCSGLKAEKILAVKPLVRRGSWQA
jgi:hypothetical protein